MLNRSARYYRTYSINSAIYYTRTFYLTKSSIIWSNTARARQSRFIYKRLSASSALLDSKSIILISTIAETPSVNPDQEEVMPTVRPLLLLLASLALLSKMAQSSPLSTITDQPESQFRVVKTLGEKPTETEVTVSGNLISINVILSRSSTMVHAMKFLDVCIPPGVDPGQITAGVSSDCKLVIQAPRQKPASPARTISVVESGKPAPPLLSLTDNSENTTETVQSELQYREILSLPDNVKPDEVKVNVFDGVISGHMKVNGNDSSEPTVFNFCIPSASGVDPDKITANLTNDNRLVIEAPWPLRQESVPSERTVQVVDTNEPAPEPTSV